MVNERILQFEQVEKLKYIEAMIKFKKPSTCGHTKQNNLVNPKSMGAAIKLLITLKRLFHCDTCLIHIHTTRQ